LLSEVPSFGTAVAADSENRASLRSGGKYHRVRVSPTGANWKTAAGVEIDLVQQGGR
jgi:hypothetical protein